MEQATESSAPLDHFQRLEKWKWIDTYPKNLEEYQEEPCTTYFDMIARCGCNITNILFNTFHLSMYDNNSHSWYI